MKIVLNLLCQRCWADDADIELQVLQHLAVRLLQQARPDVKPAGIRPVARVGRSDLGVFRGEDALAKK